MLVLDACVGAEKIYDGLNKKLSDNFIGIDIRKGDYSFKLESNFTKVEVIIKPNIIADMKHLPFKDNIFDIIVMDPPHLGLGTKTSYIAKAYGSWDKEEKVRNIYFANNEFNRCLKNNGILIIKILPEDKDRYISLFNNIIFFLPIQTMTRRGCIETKEMKEAAIWLIGIKKDKA